MAIFSKPTENVIIKYIVDEELIIPHSGSENDFTKFFTTSSYQLLVHNDIFDPDLAYESRILDLKNERLDNDYYINYDWLSSLYYPNKKISSEIELAYAFYTFNANQDEKINNDNRFLYNPDHIKGKQRNIVSNTLSLGLGGSDEWYWIGTKIGDIQVPTNYDYFFDNALWPYIEAFYIERIKDQTSGARLDPKIANIYKKWWSETSKEEIKEKAKNFSSYLRSNTGWTNNNNLLGEYEGIDLGSARLFFGTMIEAYSPGTVQPSFGVVFTRDLSVPVLEVFGFSDWLREKGVPEDSSTGDALDVVEKASQGSQDGWYTNLLSDVFDDSDKDDPENILDIQQCALITGLLHKDANLGFHRYIQEEDYKSPLWASGSEECPDSAAHSRIYPVEPHYLDPNKLMNLMTIDKYQLDLLNDKNNVKGPLTLSKQLSWVYEDLSGKLRYAQIPISTEKKQKNDSRQIYDYKRAIEAYNRFSGENLNTELKRILGGEYKVADRTIVPSQLEDKISEIQSQSDYGANLSYNMVKNIQIDFNGTNPSTARKDVAVTFTWELGSIGNLDDTLVSLGSDDGLPSGTEIKIRDLITLPATKVPTLSNGPGAGFVNQYNPNYSRLRLGIVPSNALNSSALILDLSIIDHTITREPQTGIATLVINYKGYFESMMSMPFNDALANNDVITSRIKRQQAGIDQLMKENCKIETVRRAMRLEQETIGREARNTSYRSILTRLVDKNLIHSYTLDDTSLKSSTVGGSLDSTINFVQSVNKNSGTLSTTSFDTLEQALKDKKDEESLASVLTRTNQFGKHFFFLGDLLHVITDCLYEDGTAKHRDVVKNLNLRFIVGTIQVPNPNNLDGPPLTINPICIPIDVSFFVNWFNSAIVNKGLSYYPVGVFIRDFIERVVNGIIYDSCFSLLLPDETPPVLRTSYFSDSSGAHFFKASFDSLPKYAGWFLPTDPYGAADPTSAIDSEDYSIFDHSLFTNNKGFVNDTNYCIIYQQSPSFFRQMKDDKLLRNDPFTASIFYGTKNTTYNFISDLSFSKQNAPFLREARFINSTAGNLSLLSNVYNLSFSFSGEKANTIFYPGNIINFVLLDFTMTKWQQETSAPWEVSEYDDFGESNPHKENTLSNTLGMGGYFCINRVSYELGLNDNDFKITLHSFFVGTDAKRKPNSPPMEEKRIEDKQECADAFNVIADRYNELAEPGDSYESRARSTTQQTPAQQATTPPTATKVPAVSVDPPTIDVETSLVSIIGNGTKKIESLPTGIKKTTRQTVANSIKDAITNKKTLVNDMSDGTYYFETIEDNSISYTQIQKSNDKITVTRYTN